MLVLIDIITSNKTHPALHPAFIPARRGRCVSGLRGNGGYGSDMVEVVVANSNDIEDGAAGGWWPR